MQVYEENDNDEDDQQEDDDDKKQEDNWKDEQEEEHEDKRSIDTEKGNAKCKKCKRICTIANRVLTENMKKHKMSHRQK